MSVSHRKPYLGFRPVKSVRHNDLLALAVNRVTCYDHW